MYRFAVLGRFLVTGSSGPRALRVGLPLYLAIVILATVIFAGSGLDASTVVHRAEGAAVTRLILLLAWTLAALPVVRVIVSTEENAFLRWLPIPRWRITAWLGALMFFAELPWFVLWTRGGGAMRGLAATLTALALHACLVARVWTAADVMLLALTCAVWLVAPAPARISAGAVTFIVAMARAWQRVPEIQSSAPHGRLVGPPPLALARAYALVVVRRHSALLLRAAIIAAIGMAWTSLAVLNNEAPPGANKIVLRAALTGWIPSCVLAVATSLGPVLRTERAAEWVLAACGTTPSQRRAATLGLLAAAGSAFGLLTGAAMGIALASEPALKLALVVSLALSGAALAGVTEVSVRRAMREEGRDGGRLVLAVGALIAVAEGALWVAL